jgi:hypothetical protein
VAGIFIVPAEKAQDVRWDGGGAIKRYEINPYCEALDFFFNVSY